MRPRKPTKILKDQTNYYFGKVCLNELNWIKINLFSNKISIHSKICFYNYYSYILAPKMHSKNKLKLFCGNIKQRQILWQKLVNCRGGQRNHTASVTESPVTITNRRKTLVFVTKFSIPGAVGVVDPILLNSEWKC